MESSLNEIEQHKDVARMAKKKAVNCKRFKVEPGRIVICEATGEEVFSIRKQKGFSPTEASAMTHYIVKLLNKNKKFPAFYKKYMK